MGGSRLSASGQALARPLPSKWRSPHSARRQRRSSAFSRSEPAANRATEPEGSAFRAVLARSSHGGTMAIKLPRTIRLDPSDTFVYRRAAEPGEWAVTGTFLFYGVDAARLSGKEQQAFRAGFLGIDSFGWSTLAAVTEASEEERAAAVERLSQQLVIH